MIHREDRDSVAVLRIEHGKANAIDTELLTELADKLNELEQSSARAVVLTGTGSIFSAGIDLFRVLNGGREYIEALLSTLTGSLLELFTFPRPVVAAINGHTIAGGCIVTCACDYRIMAEGGGKIGVPELVVGVAFPSLALEILRFVAPNQHVQEMVYTGRTYSVEDAFRRGLIDEIASPEALLDRACEVAAGFGAISPQAFEITKRQLRRPALDRFERYRYAVDDEAMRVWTSSETEAIIRGYLQRTVGKSKST
ncbi:MAG: enoyl-CoA hydratase/isomerase family protein [Acidobacteria bacterium]|nr:enoyl-CoA hydratase/isomerase family protein [Acidobacteriota bacterium]